MRAEVKSRWANTQKGYYTTHARTRIHGRKYTHLYPRYCWDTATVVGRSRLWRGRDGNSSEWEGLSNFFFWHNTTENGTRSHRTSYTNSPATPTITQYRRTTTCNDDKNLVKWRYETSTSWPTRQQLYARQWPYIINIFSFFFFSFLSLSHFILRIFMIIVVVVLCC